MDESKCFTTKSELFEKNKISKNLMERLSSGSPNLSPKLKCVLIGDGAVGKTSLIVSYTTNGYPMDYVPTAFDNYSVAVSVDSFQIRLQICDTAGQDDFDSLRPLCYTYTDVFLVCFSTISPISFQNVKAKWIPEVKKHSKKATIILVGLQCDLRNDVKVLINLANRKEQPVPESTAESYARSIGAISYIECSALTQKNLKEVFDTAILAGLRKKGYMSKTPDIKGKLRSKPKTANKYKHSSIEEETVSEFSPLNQSNSKRKKSTAKWRKFCCNL